MGSEAPEFWLVALALGLLSVSVPQRYPITPPSYTNRFVSQGKVLAFRLSVTQ